MLRGLSTLFRRAPVISKLSRSHQYTQRNISAVAGCSVGFGSTPPKTLCHRRSHESLHKQKRCFWGVDVAFNRVDEERVRLAGSDRAAAEWVLRNGGTIKWASSSNTIADYNLLPSTQFETYKLQELDLSFTDVIGIGFEHLKDLHHVTKIRMHGCKTCGDDGLSHFVNVAQTLTAVELSSCPMITEKGLNSLTKLTKLRHLVLFDLPDVRNFDTAITNLRQLMPEVDIKTEEPSLSEGREEL